MLATTSYADPVLSFFKMLYITKKIKIQAGLENGKQVQIGL